MGRRETGVGRGQLLSLSVVSDSATPWTLAQQAPLSMGFSRQVYCSGLSFPPAGNRPHPGIEPVPPALAGRFFFFFNH